MQSIYVLEVWGNDSDINSLFRKLLKEEVFYIQQICFNHFFPQWYYIHFCQYLSSPNTFSSCSPTVTHLGSETSLDDKLDKGFFMRLMKYNSKVRHTHSRPCFSLWHKRKGTDSGLCGKACVTSTEPLAEVSDRQYNHLHLSVQQPWATGTINMLFLYPLKRNISLNNAQKSRDGNY